MHVLLFLITVGLCLAIIFLLQWILILDTRRNLGYAPRRTTFQPELFDQDEEVK